MSLLQLPDGPDVSWARLLPTGGEGGSAAFQIDASGASVRNRMMYRMLIPNGGSPSIKVRLRLKSTLTVGNPAFEGLAVRFRGYRLNGTTAFEVVWDSSPETRGMRAWYSSQSGTYTDAVFVEPVPEINGIDYMTCELLVRANSGQVTISSVECRNHYSVPYNLSTLGSQLWTSDFPIVAVATGISGDGDVLRWVRYQGLAQTNIRKGKIISAILKAAITGRAYETGGFPISRRLASTVGVMIKMRRSETGTYDYFTIGSQSVGVDSKTAYIDNSIQFRAEHDYFQTETLIYVEPAQLSAGYNFRDVDRMGFRDLNLQLLASDYVSPTQ